jgi:transposase
MFKGTKMRQHSVVKDIRRATRKQYSAEEKIRIVLEGLRGEDSIAELCRREGIAHYRWSKDFLEAGKKRLAGDTVRASSKSELDLFNTTTPPLGRVPRCWRTYVRDRWLISNHRPRTAVIADPDSERRERTLEYYSFKWFWDC